MNRKRCRNSFECARMKQSSHLKVCISKKSISLIGSRKQLAEARSFHRIDKHVVTENLYYRHSCNCLNRLPKAKTVRHIFSWSTLPYSFS